MPSASCSKKYLKSIGKSGKHQKSFWPESDLFRMKLNRKKKKSLIFFPAIWTNKYSDFLDGSRI